MKNIQDFLKEHENKIFRFWIYKKVWTPYEINLRSELESYYESEQCQFGKILNIYQIPDDLLIEFIICDEDNNLEESGTKEYHKLSDISLSLLDFDNKGEICD